MVELELVLDQLGQVEGGAGRPPATHHLPLLYCKYSTEHASSDTVPSYSVAHFSYNNSNEWAMYAKSQMDSLS